MKVKIKPLSTNQAHRAVNGRVIKSKKYREFEEELLWKLPPCKVPNIKLRVEYTFGVSSKLSDWDNLIKPFQDVLQKKYGFNDRDIYRASVEKIDVKKGEEFIDFEIESFE